MMTSLPKRAISAPVKKLGANMARTCHWMPSAALSSPRPQATIASGAAVITRLISAYEPMPQITATMKRGWRAISISGRPRRTCSSAAAGAPRH